MKKYKVQITDQALSDMEEIYDYIAEHLQAPATAIGQYNRIADTIETLVTFPERIKLMESEQERRIELRLISVDNYSVFFHIRDNCVIVTNVLYSASDMTSHLKI